MKNMLRIVCAALLLGGLGLKTLAQDPISVAPDMYRVLFENERVRVMEVTFQLGQSIPPHSHPDHYVYVVEGGTLKLSKPDGSSADITVEAGQVLWIPAETHWAENIGSTVICLIVNELKEGGHAGHHAISEEETD
jgi:quercetin dioxygenase-like cupin family protein